MKKKIVMIAMLACLSIGWGIRFYQLNTNTKQTIVQIYDAADTVAVEKDFFDRSDEDMDGYMVKVLSAELVSVKDFLISNGLSNDNMLAPNIDYFYVVKILVKNEYNPYSGEKGIDLGQYLLHGTNYILTVDDIAFSYVNPERKSQTFSLEIGKSTELTLPFTVTEMYIAREHLMKDLPRLQISAYPHMKLINLH